MCRSAKELDDKLEKQSELNSLKVTAHANKGKQLQDLMQACGCRDKMDINPTAALTADDAAKWSARVKVICPRAKIDDDLTTTDGCAAAIRKLMTSLFGKAMLVPYEHSEAQKATGNTQRKFTKVPLLNVVRKRVNKVRVRDYSVNPAFFAGHAEIMRWSNQAAPAVLSSGWGGEVHNRVGPPVMFRCAGSTPSATVTHSAYVPGFKPH